LYQDRINLIWLIYSVITELVEIYQELYKPVQEFVESHKMITDKFGLQFNVALEPDNLADRFFGIVSHNASGSFCGTEEGEAAYRSLLSAHDFSTPEDTTAFICDLLDHLQRDYRDKDLPEVPLEKQLRREKPLEVLYDLIFSLDYLVPSYTLQFSGKDLTQLSPGERGTLLLIFYLLVDQNDIPLVIDQPEENLDNQTVYTLLGQCVREATQKRQVIMVTHNPNLAVACDADQVICATHNNTGNSVISYVSGAIENPVINKAIVDVLEGTRPAFDNRDSKYYKWD
jgi:hypothetical protein